MRSSEVVLDVAMAPAAVAARIDGSINRRGRRMFGILKTEPEYVGYASLEGFEIWERQQRAVHAVASVRGRAGRSRITLRFVLPRTTRVVGAAFFALYALAGVGIARLPPDTSLSVSELAALTLGAAVLVAGFWYAAGRQRADLAKFVARLFPDAEPGA